MTVREVVEQVIEDLGKVSVPVSQMEDIGFPVARSISALKSVVQAWDEEDAAKAKQEEEPVIELVAEPAEGEENADG